jgi:hypothetical protein
MYREVRKDLRSRTVLPARIRDTDGQPVCDCLTRDLSNSGARLEVGASTELPTNFILTFSGDESRLCELMWRSENRVGVRFH